ncbi:MAG: LLM class flavin-dependent oxidoreductase [Acidimicrobiales bacterium]
MTDQASRQMPAISLVAMPGRRARTVELAVEAERRGFTGIYIPSLGATLAFCTSIAQATSTIRFGPSVQPIYLQHPNELASTAAFLHEISGGRFELGIGVTHGPVQERLGVQIGKPLSDMRNYVAALRKLEPAVGPLPPIVLATLRSKMVELAGEIAEGAVWANASRSAMAASLAHLPAGRQEAGFIVANMVPTTIDDDRAAAAARNRATLSGYVALPNYRNYWMQAGYEEEMLAIKAAIDAGERDKVPSLMSEKWLSDATLYGSVGEVREGVERWFDAGVNPILVPSSTKGGQLNAIDEVFAAFS